jgi:hypothetical protein
MVILVGVKAGSNNVKTLDIDGDFGLIWVYEITPTF